MLQALRQQWHDLASARPGHRFQIYYQREHQKSGGSRRVWKLVVGVALMAVGIVLMFVPGPGVVFLALGGAFLAGQSQVVARGLDRVELGARSLLTKSTKWWRRTSLPTRVATAFALVATMGALAWLVWTVVLENL